MITLDLEKLILILDTYNLKDSKLDFIKENSNDFPEESSFSSSSQVNSDFHSLK